MKLMYSKWLVSLLICMMVPAFAAEPEFLILVKNREFVPAVLSIPTAEKVRNTVENQGATAEEFESYSLNREKHIPPNSRITLYIGPLSAGRYLYQSEDRADGNGPAWA